MEFSLFTPLVTKTLCDMKHFIFWTEKWESFPMGHEHFRATDISRTSAKLILLIRYARHPIRR